MTLENLIEKYKNNLEVLLAIKENKKTELFYGEWKDYKLDFDIWTLVWYLDHNRLRVKPEPTYRPHDYKSIMNIDPFNTSIYHKNSGEVNGILGIYKEHLEIASRFGSYLVSYTDLLDYKTTEGNVVGVLND